MRQRCVTWLATALAVTAASALACAPPGGATLAPSAGTAVTAGQVGGNRSWVPAGVVSVKLVRWHDAGKGVRLAAVIVVRYPRLAGTLTRNDRLGGRLDMAVRDRSGARLAMPFEAVPVPVWPKTVGPRVVHVLKFPGRAGRQILQRVTFGAPRDESGLDTRFTISPTVDGALWKSVLTRWTALPQPVRWHTTAWAHRDARCRAPLPPREARWSGADRRDYLTCAAGLPADDRAIVPAR